MGCKCISNSKKNREELSLGGGGVLGHQTFGKNKFPCPAFLPLNRLNIEKQINKFAKNKTRIRIKIIRNKGAMRIFFWYLIPISFLVLTP